MTATVPARRPWIVSFGELLWDVYPDGPRLGGASANLAHHAAQLGCESLLVSRVGRDELGRRALESLERSGVDVSAVGVDDAHPTGEVQVEFVQGEPRFTIRGNVAWDQVRCPPEARERIRRADVFCFGTLAQRTPLVRGELRQLLEVLELQGGGPVRLLDLNLRPPFIDAELTRAALERAEVVKLNEEELSALAELFELAPEASGCPERWLFDFPNLRLVALTRGARGARLFTRDAEVDHPGYPSSGVDPVGAGDAFTAVLARELARESPLAVIADRACRYAAWVASEPGAQPTPPDELLAVLGAE